MWIGWLVCCLLAGPDLWKRTPLKCSITMVFTCTLFSWCTISSLWVPGYIPKYKLIITDVCFQHRILQDIPYGGATKAQAITGLDGANPPLQQEHVVRYGHSRASVHHTIVRHLKIHCQTARWVSACFIGLQSNTWTHNLLSAAVIMSHVQPAPLLSIALFYHITLFTSYLMIY